MKYKNIIFDFDGTLVDSAPCILTCYQMVLDDFNIIPNEELSESIIGPPLIETLIMLTGIDEPHIIDAMVERFKWHYDDRVTTETLPYKDISELLNALQSTNIRLFIATNKRTLPTIKVINYLNWQDFFVSVRSIDSLTSSRKTKSLLLKDMLFEHNIALPTTLYIGDKQDDFLAAKENDLGFLAASWGYGEWNPNDAHTLLDIDALSRHLLCK